VQSLFVFYAHETGIHVRIMLHHDDAAAMLQTV
jgi:hypothetical protein